MLHVEGDLVARMQRGLAQALAVDQHVGVGLAQHGLSVHHFNHGMMFGDSGAVDADVRIACAANFQRLFQADAAPVVGTAHAAQNQPQVADRVALGGRGW